MQIYKYKDIWLVYVCFDVEGKKRKKKFKTSGDRFFLCFLDIFSIACLKTPFFDK